MKELYKKLFEVKKEWISLLRDTKAYNYKYATLGQIHDKLNPVLQKLWLIVVHNVKEWKVITRIIDTDTQQEISSEITINTTKPQDQWSEITYYRRYNLVCLLDLEVEDDDAKKAQNNKKNIFDQKKYDWLIKWSTWKWKEEIMQYVLKIKKDYDIQEDLKEKLDLFINWL